MRVSTEGRLVRPRRFNRRQRRRFEQKIAKEAKGEVGKFGGPAIIGLKPRVQWHWRQVDSYARDPQNDLQKTAKSFEQKIAKEAKGEVGKFGGPAIIGLKPRVQCIGGRLIRTLVTRGTI